MKIRQVSKEVYYDKEKITKVTRTDIDWLKEKALENERGRVRLCAHQDVNDHLHEMLIVHAANTYVRVHKHIDKSESFHVVQGALDVIVFSDLGKISQVIRMGDFSTDRIFYYRLSEPHYHSLIVRTEVVVFHETTNGPFNRSDTIFAPWAPDEKDEKTVKSFMEDLSVTAEKY